jgi:hypothetical protein
VKHFSIPVNRAVRRVDATVALPARPPKHRPSRKKKLALLAADIRHGAIPTQKALADALGICVTMISAAENLSSTERAAVDARERPLIMPTRLAYLLAPVGQLESKAAQPDLITDQALTEIVRTAGVDRVLAAVEPFLS